jgi:hypothetical protein
MQAANKHQTFWAMIEQMFQAISWAELEKKGSEIWHVALFVTFAHVR